MECIADKTSIYPATIVEKEMDDTGKVIKVTVNGKEVSSTSKTNGKNGDFVVATIRHKEQFEEITITNKAENESIKVDCVSGSLHYRKGSSDNYTEIRTSIPDRSNNIDFITGEFIRRNGKHDYMYSSLSHDNNFNIEYHSDNITLQFSNNSEKGFKYNLILSGIEDCVLYGKTIHSFICTISKRDEEYDECACYSKTLNMCYSENNEFGDYYQYMDRKTVEMLISDNGRDCTEFAVSSIESDISNKDRQYTCIYRFDANDGAKLIKTSKENGIVEKTEYSYLTNNARLTVDKTTTKCVEENGKKMDRVTTTKAIYNESVGTWEISGKYSNIWYTTKGQIGKGAICRTVEESYPEIIRRNSDRGFLQFPWDKDHPDFNYDPIVRTWRDAIPDFIKEKDLGYPF